MEITHSISLDFQRFKTPSQIDVVQDDTYSRYVRVTLYDDMSEWVVPDGATVAVRFRKPDRTQGVYDTLPDGTVAYSVDGNTVTVGVAPQMLTVKGKVTASVVMFLGSTQLATFPFVLNVVENPAAGRSVSNDYYYLQTWDDVNAAIGDLSKLETLDKTSLVAAINEIISLSGGTITDDQIKAAVDKYLEANPPLEETLNKKVERSGDTMTGDLILENASLTIVGNSRRLNLVGTNGEGAYLAASDRNGDGHPVLECMGTYGDDAVRITGIAAPEEAVDAANKDYVDRKVQEAVGSGGEAGGYYAPSVDSGGNLTWTASRPDMPAVPGANITGPAGATGPQGPAGADGSKGDMGVGIASIARTSGTGAAGTTDTYTITLTDGSTSTFTVYNGKDGASGSGSSAVTSVNGKTGNVKLPVSGFGTCATAASTAIKVVDGLPEDFLVQDGAQLCVKFSNANTAAMPKLSVAGASAAIFDARTSKNVDAAWIGARTHHFVYFSGIWVLLDALQIPVPTRDDHGKFLRVFGQAYVLEALTDVSEVGA